MKDDCCNKRPHVNGCPYAPEPPTPRCPVCNKETDTYLVYSNEIIGCDTCIISTDAYEWQYVQGGLIYA